MKKTVLFLLVFLMLVAMPMTIMAKGNLRVLVAYYSKGGTTQKMAESIARYTGGDLLRIEPVVPYSENGDSFVIRAKDEIKRNVRIELKKYDVNFDDYDVIFIGSPVWFGDWAAPAASFARDERLTGHWIIPFMTTGREEPGVLDLLFKKYVETKPDQGLCIIDEKMENGGERMVLKWVCNKFSVANNGEMTTMNVLATLRDMKCRYPKITLCDVYKSFYQDYFGAGHIIKNKSKSTKYIKEELKQVDGMSVGVERKCKGMRIEATGIEACGALGRYVRVDLWKIKSGEYKMNDYVDLLMQSVEENIDADGWLKEWDFVLSVMKEYGVRVDNYDEDLRLITSRLAMGEYGMHHSNVFNECYHPHYRIIKREFIK